MSVNSLNGTRLSAGQFLNLVRARVVPPICQSHRQNTLGMLLEQHAHGVNAVDRLGILQAVSARHIFDQIQIDETLDGIHRRYDHPDVRTGTQPSAPSTPGPCMSILLHDVFIVPEVIEMQQPVDSYIQDLYETPKLDHRRDDPVECLSDALAQIGALQKRRYVAICLVSALLELRS